MKKLLLLLSILPTFGYSAYIAPLVNTTNMAVTPTNFFSSNILAGANMTFTKDAQGRLTLDSTGGGGGGASNAVTQLNGTTNAQQVIEVSTNAPFAVSTNGAGAKATNTINIPLAGVNQSGQVHSNDWQLFNSKQSGSTTLSNLASTGAITNVSTTNIVWVDPGGNDSTGVRGRVDKPFLTLTNAYNAALAGGDTIWVRPGSYITPTNNTSLIGKAFLNWYFDPGTTVYFGNSADGTTRALFSDTADGAGGGGLGGIENTNYIFGYANFVSSNQNSHFVYMASNNSKIYIECNNLYRTHTGSGYACLYQKSGSLVANVRDSIKNDGYDGYWHPAGNASVWLRAARISVKDTPIEVNEDFRAPGNYFDIGVIERSAAYGLSATFFQIGGNCTYRIGTVNINDGQGQIFAAAPFAGATPGVLMTPLIKVTATNFNSPVQIDNPIRIVGATFTGMTNYPLDLWTNIYLENCTIESPTSAPYSISSTLGVGATAFVSGTLNISKPIDPVISVQGIAVATNALSIAASGANPNKAHTNTVTIFSKVLAGATRLGWVDDVTGTNIFSFLNPAAGQAIIFRNNVWTNEAVAGTGDVTAAANFATDNRAIRSDGTAKGVQSSLLEIDDSGNSSTPGGLFGSSITSTNGSTNLSYSVFRGPLIYPPLTFTTDFIDATITNTQIRTLTGNTTLHTTNFVLGSYINLLVYQDGTGIRTLTIDSTNTLKWRGSTNQTVTLSVNTNAGFESVYQFYKANATTIEISGPETAPHINEVELAAAVIASGMQGGGAILRSNAPAIWNPTINGGATFSAAATFQDGIDVSLGSRFRSTVAIDGKLSADSEQVTNKTRWLNSTAFYEQSAGSGASNSIVETFIGPTAGQFRMFQLVTAQAGTNQVMETNATFNSGWGTHLAVSPNSGTVTAYATNALTLMASNAVTFQADFTGGTPLIQTSDNMRTNVTLYLTNPIPGRVMTFHFRGDGNAVDRTVTIATNGLTGNWPVSWGWNSPTNGATAFTVTNNIGAELNVLTLSNRFSAFWQPMR